MDNKNLVLIFILCDAIMTFHILHLHLDILSSYLTQVIIISKQSPELKKNTLYLLNIVQQLLRLSLEEQSVQKAKSAYVKQLEFLTGETQKTSMAASLSFISLYLMSAVISFYCLAKSDTLSGPQHS